MEGSLPRTRGQLGGEEAAVKDDRFFRTDYYALGVLKALVKIEEVARVS